MELETGAKFEAKSLWAVDPKSKQWAVSTTEIKTLGEIFLVLDWPLPATTYPFYR